MLKLNMLVLALLIASPSLALSDETYCQTPAISLYDGADHTIDWLVTTNGARKIQKVGQTKPTKGCSRDFRTTGMILSRQIIQQSTLGTFRVVNKYRVYYESSRPGTDEIAYKTTWAQGTKTASAIVRIKVRVIDKAI